VRWYWYIYRHCQQRHESQRTCHGCYGYRICLFLRFFLDFWTLCQQFFLVIWRLLDLTGNGSQNMQYGTHHLIFREEGEWGNGLYNTPDVRIFFFSRNIKYRIHFWHTIFFSHFTNILVEKYRVRCFINGLLLFSHFFCQYTLFS